MNRTARKKIEMKAHRAALKWVPKTVAKAETSELCFKDGYVEGHRVGLLAGRAEMRRLLRKRLGPVIVNEVLSDRQLPSGATADFARALK